MTDAEAIELQDFLNTSKAHIEALAGASAGWQARAEQAEAKLAVLGGEWCAENRAAGRGPCGACAWCCQQERARAEAAEADAVECRKERARYSDVMTEKLAAAEAEAERLRAQMAQLTALMEARRLLSEVYNAFGQSWPAALTEDVGKLLDKTSDW